MKRLLYVSLFCLAGALSSCQCSDKPEIGPVEDAETSATTSMPDNLG